MPQVMPACHDDLSIDLPLPKKGPGYNMDRTPKCGLPEKKPGYARLAICETYFILTALFISVTRFR
jgi:hypothetical protein